MAVLTSRQLLTDATAIFTARATDLRLSAVHRAQAGECAQRTADILSQLNPNNTLPNNRRQPAIATLNDRAGVMGNIDRVHPDDLAPGELYNGIDMMTDFVWLVQNDLTSGEFFY